VQFTRRVYRDGQGEYLINQQLSRLRDIKDLFLGSGASQGAYAVIEQGRVDALLQASHIDRRTIFEEAAGISRFKARKVETLRKLEHVEQNLHRSNDILVELDKQLRAVRLQAAKAQRYQEYNGRLQELRVGLGLQEFHELTLQLRAETQALTGLRTELERAAAETTSGEAQLQQHDAGLTEIESQVHERESRLAEARQQIAAQEAKRDFEAAAAIELETELERTRHRRGELAERVAQLTGQAQEARHEWQADEADSKQRRAQLDDLEKRLQDTEQELSRLRNQVETDRTEHLERLRQATRFQNDAIGLKTRFDSLRNRRDGLSARSARTAEHLASIGVELETLEQTEARFQKELANAREEQGRLAEEQADIRRQAESARQKLADLRVQRSGLVSRIELLEQLERSQEGLGVGVRQVLELVRTTREQGSVNSGEDWSFVIGLVADFISAPRDVASLIDLALGETSQCFIVRDMARLAHVLGLRTEPFASRVGFLPLPLAEANSETASSQGISLTVLHAGEAGSAMQRADELVSCDQPDLRHLPRLLLGNTRIVPDLAAARAVAASPEGQGLRFVTRQGELLEADGRLTVGMHHAESGVLSRKSELHELRQLIVDLDFQCADAEYAFGKLRDRGEAMEQPLFEIQQRINDLVEEAGDMNARVKLHRQKRSGLEDEVALSRDEIGELDRELIDVEVRWAEACGLAEEGERQAAEVQARAEHADRRIREQEGERGHREQECSQSRVELAQIEERLASRQQRAAQLEADLTQRQREAAQAAQHETATADRMRESRLARLAASAALAEWFAHKEDADVRLVELSAQREQVRADRQQCAERLHAVAGVKQEKSDLAHSHDLRASELRLRVNGLRERLREDYQIELAQLYESKTVCMPPLESNAAQQEIDELRRKLARLGAVNLEALQELTDLENRVTEKKAQHDDLMKSQMDLLEIIHRINQDSKKLFTETFASIRSHFQDLFRKLFGGGMADIILEDENDVLECGIEINARPPGKELRSISLMSGGERTLTAIALLMAIFRAKPSPFCLLDEVDAALDEANNVRLASVLREFLDQSQFIVITHKKRTMAVADVLYGITMQEAGVSKQVSVRFEDWPDEEEARAAG
jgi:chromosome segregation protein